MLTFGDADAGEVAGGGAFTRTIAEASESAALRYEVAVGSSLAALAAVYLFDEPFAELPPFFLFYAAVAVSSWFGGLRAGLLATILGAVGTTFVSLEPRYSLIVADVGDRARLFLFVLVGALIAWLNGALRSSQRLCEREAAAARRAESRAKRLAEANLIGVFFSDLNGNIRSANEAFLNLVGRTSADLQAGTVNWHDVTAPEHRDRDRRAIEELKACRVCTPFEKDHVVRNGQRVPVLFGCALLEESDDECVGFVLDLTERKRAEAEAREHQAQLQEVSAELMLAEERERRRIATVLHDAVGQTLALAQLKVSAARRAAGANGLETGLAEVHALIDDAVRHTRSLTSELSPPVLYELGLEAAVQWLGDRCREQHGIDVQVRDDKQPKPISHEGRLVLFQAVRELLVNVIKHARASACAVSVQRDGGRIRIQVQDNGTGFTTPTRPGPRPGDGFGLFNIRERLAHVGGSVDVHAPQGRGTTVTLTAPLAKTRQGEQS